MRHCWGYCNDVSGISQFDKLSKKVPVFEAGYAPLSASKHIDKRSSLLTFHPDSLHMDLAP
jgi:hypothetical protein